MENTGRGRPNDRAVVPSEIHFVFSVIVWESLVEDFVKGSLGVRVVFVEGKNGAGEVPGEVIDGELGS